MKLPNAIMKPMEKHSMTLTFLYTHTYTHTKQWSKAKTVDLQMMFRASGQLAECLPHSNSIRSVRYVLDNWYVQDNKPGFCI